MSLAAALPLIPARARAARIKPDARSALLVIDVQTFEEADHKTGTVLAGYLRERGIRQRMAMHGVKRIQSADIET